MNPNLKYFFFWWGEGGGAWGGGGGGGWGGLEIVIFLKDPNLKKKMFGGWGGRRASVSEFF